MPIEARIRELGIELPPVPTPAANYVNAVQMGNAILTCLNRSGTTGWNHSALGKVGGRRVYRRVRRHCWLPRLSMTTPPTTQTRLSALTVPSCSPKKAIPTRAVAAVPLAAQTA